MNRKAIREDGMPGGRNKNIGPVTLSQSEVDMVLSGREFDDENLSGNGDHSTNQSGGNGNGSGSGGIHPPITFPTTVNSFASLPSINNMNNFNKNMHNFNNQTKIQNKPVIPNMTLQQQQTTNYLLNKSGPFFAQQQNINANQNRGLSGPETLLRAASLANVSNFLMKFLKTLLKYFNLGNGNRFHRKRKCRLDSRSYLPTS